MRLSMSKTALLLTASAEIAPVAASALDPERWSAISTITFANMPALTPTILPETPSASPSPSLPELSLAAPTAATNAITASPTPSGNPDFDAEPHVDLKLRAPAPENVVNPALSQPPTTATTYPATITTMWVQTQLPNGQTTFVEVIYTQMFAATPAPAEEAMTVAAGQIGLGTLTGEVGVLETSMAAKASKASAVAAGEDVENAAAGRVGGTSGRGGFGGRQLAWGVLGGLGSVAVGMVLLV